MERRLAAILAADIAGYSRLVGIDEEGTLRAQRAHRTELIEPLLEKYGGRVANTAGDSLLIEFPSAVEAVRFAVAMQEGMSARNSSGPEERRIQYRVGINVGDVVAEGEDLLGDGVNIAARLEALAAPGEIVLSRTARDQVRDRLEYTLADLGEFSVKNIVRPVRAFQIVRNGENLRPVAFRGKRNWRLLIAAATVLIVVVAGWLYFSRTDVVAANPSRMAFPLPEKPSLAVQPFESMSGDQSGDEDYFIDGLSEDVITELSKLPEIFVISRRASFSFKDKDADINEIAERLGVRYILTGSVRRDEGRFRINAQLTDALRGRHIWAERYDRPLEDMFKVQSDLAEKIVTALDVKLVSGALGQQRRNTTQNPEAYDLLVRGIREARQVTQEGVAIGRRLFEQALEIDPGYVRAKSWLARTYLWEARYGWGLTRKEAIAKAEEVLGDSEGHYAVRAVIHLLREEYDAALQARESAAAEFPNSADAQARLGQQLLLMGRPEEAIERFQAAMRLSPVYPIWYLGRLGDAYRLAGRPDEAIAAFKGVLERKPNDVIHGRIRLVATLMSIGKTASAKSEASRIIELKPSFNVSSYMKTRLYQHQKIREALKEALLAAGLPLNGM